MCSFIAEQVTREQIRTSNGDILIDCAVIDWLAISGDTLMKPWMWWQFLTYGFTHDVGSINHLLFNMIGLFVFGRDVEYRLGRKEFLRFYLIAVILGGIVGSVTHLLDGNAGLTIGASGAVIGTSILFACFFPNRELLLMLVIPVKAWVMAIIFITVDLAGALGLFVFEYSLYRTSCWRILRTCLFSIRLEYAETLKRDSSAMDETIQESIRQIIIKNSRSG